MIITKTPFRMSFFGGGTDIPDFFMKHGGSVISTTFDKYVYITIRHLPRFFTYSTELIYSKTERVTCIDDIEHPLVKNAMKMMDMHELHIAYDADLPARSGLGTSSTFAVGLINAFNCLKGKYLSKQQLAEKAIYLERTLCNEAGGWQDQIAASVGGFNRIDFDSDGFHVNPIIISSERKKKLNDNLMLYFSGFTRFSAEIQKEAKKSMKNNVNSLIEIKNIVDEAQDILTNTSRDLDDFGRLLDKTWRLKRKTSENITTDLIDNIYNQGLKEGALGGKLLGAGGGGFMLFYVQPEKQEHFSKAMSNYMRVPFHFENSGTSVIYYSPETYEKSEMKEQL
ncbi:MAG: kinase [Bacilli bacterium]|nr:kinase [Bacilli bacterium]